MTQNFHGANQTGRPARTNNPQFQPIQPRERQWPEEREWTVENQDRNQETDDMEQNLYKTVEELEKRKEKKKETNFKAILKVLVCLLFICIGWLIMEVLRYKDMLAPLIQ